MDTDNKTVKLPPPKLAGTVSIEEAISKRRSRRVYSSNSLSDGQVSQLLWAAQGVTDIDTEFRTAPSAGAIYPDEIYLATHEGLFHYNTKDHSLTKTINGDIRPALSSAAFGQPFIIQAYLTLIICTDYIKIKTHYGEKGSRYADIETGHIAQNVHLQAAALGLASLPVGAFSEKEVCQLLKLPKNLEPVYIIPIGFTK